MTRSTTIAALLLVWLWSSTAAAQNRIFVDQLGYTPEMAKFVFSTVAADSFHVIGADGRKAYSGALELWKTDDPATGMTLYRGDFSALTTAGKYRVVLTAGAITPEFQISRDVYAALTDAALKMLYFQRCGLRLLPEFAGKYNRNRCHPADAFLHASTGASGFVPTTGGWHDAGDFGKYSGPGAVTIGTLLLGYEAFPDRFAADSLGIPESGNGVPDLLDECRWELEWLLKMQTADGGVYHKLTSERFSSFVMPDQHHDIRYLYPVSSAATGAFAAAMARASRTFRTYDTAFADTCLAAAERAWRYLTAHPQIVPPGGFRNPAGTETGEYGDDNDRDERLWAAAELFAATGKSEYHQYFQQHAPAGGQFHNTFGWRNVQDLALLTYLLHPRSDRNTTLLNRLRAGLLAAAQELVDKRNRSGFHILLEQGEFYWGSNSIALNRAILLVFAYEESREAQFLAAAADQLHYVLGTNPHGMSFVSGFGAVSPMHPHHRQSEVDGIDEPVPGMLAGGPNQYLNDPALRARFDSSTPPALAYLDETASYASNEIAIYWNAPLVFLAGYFGAAGSPSGIGRRPDALPQDFRLDPVFPNPFNAGTTLQLHAAEAGEVTLQIVDVLGKIVYLRSLRLDKGGTFRVRWDARNLEGRPLESGVYFAYLIRGRRHSTPRKMLLLR